MTPRLRGFCENCIPVLPLSTPQLHQVWVILVRLGPMARLLECTMCGAPCETYSARYHCPGEEQGAPLQNLPRPLRTAAVCFGLDGLRFKEYRQLSAGQNFSQQGMNAMACHCIHGGAMIPEHPAPPRDPGRASVWTSPAACLLRGHPGTRLHIVKKYVWGAPVPKPTGLMAMNFLYSPIQRIPRTLQRGSCLCASPGAWESGSTQTVRLPADTFIIPQLVLRLGVCIHF